MKLTRSTVHRVLLAGTTALVLSCSALNPVRLLPSVPGEPAQPPGTSLSPTQAASNAAIDHGNAIFLADVEPETLDPAKWTGSAEEIVGDLFSGLVRLSPDLQVVPDLAESWDVSSDGTVYTFHLRPGVVFHSSRPFTAHDVKFSWERALSPATGSFTAPTYLSDILGTHELMSGSTAELEGINVIDDLTLSVTLDGPKAYFLAKLAYPTSWIVDRETADDIEANPIGTGPFRLLRRTIGEEIVLQRNPDYSVGPAALEYIVYRIYPGYPVQLYEGGEIDFTYLPEDLLQRAGDPADTLYGQVYPETGLCTYFGALDASQPPFDDPEVRRAFALAIDKDRYSDVVRDGLLPPAAGLFPPGLPGYSGQAQGLGYDPEAARQALLRSSYGGPDALPEITLTDNGAGTDLDPSTAFLVQSWKEVLGVTVDVEQLDSFGFSDEVYAGNHGQIVPWGWCADYPDPENFADLLFHSGSLQNIGHYANPEVDALLESARSEQDLTARLALYRQAEQLLIDDGAAIFLAHSATNYVLVKPYITGYRSSPIGIAQHMNLAISPP
jgi:oligopeptide transport system substrate-binding protein